MSDPARVAKYSQQAMGHGFFFALEQARISGAIGPNLFAHEYRRYYGMMLEGVQEALKETKHIEKALHRMQIAAQHGRLRQAPQGVYTFPDNDQVQDGLRLFQAWLASLFETYVTLFGYIEGTHGATRKVNEFASASLKLIQMRATENNMGARHSELFQSLTEL